MNKYTYIDAHSHLVNFYQKSKSLKQTLFWMDKNNISSSVIFGIPLKRTDEKYNYFPQTDDLLAQEYLKLKPSEQKRFYPLICGFNPTNESALTSIKEKIAKYPGIWHGLGEIMFRHDKLSKKIMGPKPRINHPAMDKIYAFCANRKMPILVHQNLNSFKSSPNPQAMQELEETLNKHKDTTFVLAHAGTTPTIYNTNQPEIVRELLSYHDNLYVDFSWRINNRHIFRAGQLDDAWVKLVSDFSDRICLGSDNTQIPQQIPSIINRFNPLLNALNPKPRNDISFETSKQLYSQEKI